MNDSAPLAGNQQEADSFKISANMPYICSKKFDVLVKLGKTFCGIIAKNCSKALN